MKTFKEHFNKYVATLLVVAVSVLTACNVNDNSEATGTMRVSLTDAPGDFAAVNIEVEQVLVKRAGEDTDDAEETEGMDDEELEDSGWEVIFNDSLTINLLDYQNGQLLTLGETEVEAGVYEEIRFVLGDNNTVELLNGSTFDLTTPSAQTSGYKLKISSEVNADEVVDLVIDFDASQSIVITGLDTYILEPVLRTVEADEKATISGKVLPVEADVWIYTVADGDTVSTRPNAEGEFTLYGLSEGFYSVTLDAQSELYADSDSTLTGIELEENQNFELEETITLEADTQR